MIKIKNTAKFDKSTNRMKIVANIQKAIIEFKKDKNRNLNFLLFKRFNWMNNYISENDNGLEVGAGAGFTRKYIKNKNFLISDYANFDHLDLKNIDAQDTKLEKESFNFIIASNMLHHVPYPIKFLNEMFRILKPNGKLIIQEAHPSLIFQIITLIMHHEGFDFTKNVWDEKIPMSQEDDVWSGNIAISHLIFDNMAKFNEKFGDKFEIIHQKFFECFIFLNSGGVSSKTIYLPLNNFFLKILSFLDDVLIKIFPNIFALGRQIVLRKK